MIDFIKGKIVDITSTHVVVENQNIGYQILCANPFAYQSHQDEITKIYTYQYVREDLIALYGFKSKEERLLFTKLLSVSGIGPKGALAILASGQPDYVISAIENEDDKYLTKFPGIGKKTARQIILDLKGKFKGQFFEEPTLIDDRPLMSTSSANYSARDEALEALAALGYSEREIKKVEEKLIQEGLTSEEYVKLALKLMLSN